MRRLISLVLSVLFLVTALGSSTVAAAAAPAPKTGSVTILLCEKCLGGLSHVAIALQDQYGYALYSYAPANGTWGKGAVLFYSISPKEQTATSIRDAVNRATGSNYNRAILFKEVPLASVANARRTALSFIGTDYNILTHNCTSMTKASADAAGLNTPSAFGVGRPATWFDKVVDANKNNRNATTR